MQSLKKIHAWAQMKVPLSFRRKILLPLYCGHYESKGEIIDELISSVNTCMIVRKYVFGGLRTTQAQTSLCIRAV